MNKNINLLISFIMFVLPPFFSYFLSNYFTFIFVKNNWLDSFLLSLFIWLGEWLVWHLFQIRYILYFWKLREFANKSSNFIGISERENKNIGIFDEKNYLLIKNNLEKYNHWTEPLKKEKTKFKIIWWTMVPVFKYIQETTRSKSTAKVQNLEIKNGKMRITFNYVKTVYKNRNLHQTNRNINGSATILFDKLNNDVLFFGYKNNNEKVAFNGFIFMK